MAAWVIPVVMAATAAVASASSSSKAASQAKINADLKAREKERNALIAQRNAKRERDIASIERADNRKRGREFRGRQLVQQLKSGVRVGGGTPLRVAMQTADQIELEIEKQAWANEENALAMEMQRDGFISQANAERYRGGVEAGFHKRQAQMSLLLGGGKAAAAYYGYRV